MSGEDMSVNLVEAGVRQRIAEPTIERGLRVIESAAPRQITLGQRRVDRFAGSGIEASPATVDVTRDPRALRTSLGFEPMNFATGDIAMKLAWIRQTLA